MQKTRYSEDQMVDPAWADLAPVSKVAQKHGISDVTIYAWRKRFGLREAVDVKRLRQIETENARVREAPMVAVVRDLAAQYPRYGYRGIRTDRTRAC
jgi:putative transposase